MNVSCISQALTGRKRGRQSPETIAKRVAATRATKLAKQDLTAIMFQGIVDDAVAALP